MNYCLILGSFLALSTLALLTLCCREMKATKTYPLQDQEFADDQAPAIDEIDDSPDPENRYWEEAVQPISPANGIELQWMESGYNHAISDLITMLERVVNDPAEDTKVQATLGAIAAELRGSNHAE